METRKGAAQEVHGTFCKSPNRSSKQIKVSSKIYDEITKILIIIQSFNRAMLKIHNCL
jgi:hypothetical protein